MRSDTMDIDQGTARCPSSGPRSRRSGRGFSLLEITTAVSILAVLGAIAQESFRSHAMHARRSEAKLGLTAIARAQAAHHGAFMAYGDDFVEIGSPLEGGVRLDDRTFFATTYMFSIRALPRGANAKGSFQAIATGDLDPGDGVLDVLMIENQLRTLR